MPPSSAFKQAEQPRGGSGDPRPRALLRGPALLHKGRGRPYHERSMRFADLLQLEHAKLAFVEPEREVTGVVGISRSGPSGPDCGAWTRPLRNSALLSGDGQATGAWGVYRGGRGGRDSGPFPLPTLARRKAGFSFGVGAAVSGGLGRFPMGWRSGHTPPARCGCVAVLLKGGVTP